MFDIVSSLQEVGTAAVYAVCTENGSKVFVKVISLFRIFCSESLSMRNRRNSSVFLSSGFFHKSFGLRFSLSLCKALKRSLACFISNLICFPISSYGLYISSFFDIMCLRKRREPLLRRRVISLVNYDFLSLYLLDSTFDGMLFVDQSKQFVPKEHAQLINNKSICAGQKHIIENIQAMRNKTIITSFVQEQISCRPLIGIARA